MRMPKARMAFDGEVTFLFSRAQVGALSPSRGLPGEEYLAQAPIGSDDISANGSAACHREIKNP